LIVLFERNRAGCHLYVCAGGPLGTIGMPASWTNLSTPPSEKPLMIESLIELAALVKALKK